VTERNLELLETVLDTTRRLAEGLAPGDLTRPTPCDEFDVRGLLEHVIGWQLVTGACAVDLEPPLADGSPTYRASSEVAHDLRSASAELLRNLRKRSDATITMPYRGVTPVDVMHAELVAEAAIHTWDLGAAIGVSVDFDDDVVSAAHEGLSLLLGESFAEIGFRRPQPTGAGTSELVRLLERSGRTPGDWAVA
jgi:uncharacterized protein (TIGR03086 family)